MRQISQKESQQATSGATGKPASSGDGPRGLSACRPRIPDQCWFLKVPDSGQMTFPIVRFITEPTQLPPSQGPALPPYHHLPHSQVRAHPRLQNVPSYFPLVSSLGQSPPIQVIYLALVWDAVTRHTNCPGSENVSGPRDTCTGYVPLRLIPGHHNARTPL